MSGPETDWTVGDGVVELRPPRPHEVAQLIAGRDAEFHRWLGPGDDDPRPAACIVVDDELVGWIDFDVDRSWLRPGEVNVGYTVFAAHRGHSYATRALELLLVHLARDTEFHTATLLIDAENERSLAVAHRAGFTFLGDFDGNPYFARVVPDAGSQLPGDGMDPAGRHPQG